MRANIKSVTDSTEAVRKQVDSEGRRFHIKARNGKRVVLEGVKDVRGFNSYAQGGTKWVGRVRGIPEGFWTIVEYGTWRHIITARGGRVTRSGRAVMGKYSKGKTLRLFGEGHAFSDLKPVSAGKGGNFGPYQWVMHPGHNPLGNPWEVAMRAATHDVDKIHELTANRELVTAWVDEK